LRDWAGELFFSYRVIIAKVVGGVNA